MLVSAIAAIAAAQTLSRMPAPEARQGVATDGTYVYAVGDSEIGKYDRRTGEKVGGWQGDPAVFPHLNACAVVAQDLVCASSNYPSAPMASTVQVFDLATLTPKRSITPSPQPGSLTWVDRREGAWWACFANYDGKGGEPGRDHRFTTLLRYDDQWKVTGVWTFPASVLAQLKPRSASGGAWGADGRLYVTGHDAPEVYVLTVPRRGTELVHVATISIEAPGQAIAFDPTRPGVLYGIRRSDHEVLEMQLPPLEGP